MGNTLYAATEPGVWLRIRSWSNAAYPQAYVVYREVDPLPYHSFERMGRFDGGTSVDFDPMTVHRYWEVHFYYWLNDAWRRTQAVRLDVGTPNLTVAHCDDADRDRHGDGDLQ